MLGRKMYAREILRIVTAENIVAAYQSSASSANWAEWTESNPRPARLLAEARALAEDTNA